MFNTKQIIALLVACALFFSLVGMAPANRGSYKDAMWLLKAEEGLKLEAYWDVTQWTNGWGTKACYPGEVITRAEADKRLLERYNREVNYLTSTYPHLDLFTCQTLAVARYNLGSFGKGMKKALKEGDLKKIAKYLRKYNKVKSFNADGTFSLKVHKGIDRRRRAEARMLLEGAIVTKELKTREIVLAHIKNSK